MYDLTVCFKCGAKFSDGPELNRTVQTWHFAQGVTHGWHDRPIGPKYRLQQGECPMCRHVNKVGNKEREKSYYCTA